MPDRPVTVTFPKRAFDALLDKLRWDRRQQVDGHGLSVADADFNEAIDTLEQADKPPLRAA